jgi:hypothetical protein
MSDASINIEATDYLDIAQWGTTVGLYGETRGNFHTVASSKTEPSNNFAVHSNVGDVVGERNISDVTEYRQTVRYCPQEEEGDRTDFLEDMEHFLTYFGLTTGYSPSVPPPAVPAGPWGATDFVTQWMIGDHPNTKSFVFPAVDYEPRTYNGTINVWEPSGDLAAGYPKTFTTWDDPNFLLSDTGGPGLYTVAISGTYEQFPDITRVQSWWTYDEVLSAQRSVLNVGHVGWKSLQRIGGGYGLEHFTYGNADISGLEAFDSMDGMFFQAFNLKSVNLDGMVIPPIVTRWRLLTARCFDLWEIDLSGVTFNNCGNLTNMLSWECAAAANVTFPDNVFAAPNFDMHSFTSLSPDNSVAAESYSRFLIQAAAYVQANGGPLYRYIEWQDGVEDDYVPGFLYTKEAAVARNYLINTAGWTILDGGGLGWEPVPMVVTEMTVDFEASEYVTVEFVGHQHAVNPHDGRINFSVVWNDTLKLANFDDTKTGSAKYVDFFGFGIPSFGVTQTNASGSKATVSTTCEHRDAFKENGDHLVGQNGLCTSVLSYDFSGLPDETTPAGLEADMSADNNDWIVDSTDLNDSNDAFDTFNFTGHVYTPIMSISYYYDLFFEYWSGFVTLDSLEIVGPDTAPKNSDTQYICIGHWSDGSSPQIGALWSIPPAAYVSIDANTGLLTAGSPPFDPLIPITAEFDGLSVIKQVLLVDP